MKFRKVQEVGRGTLLISLPKDWARRVGVSRGSFVAVRERADGCLVIDPSYESPAEPTKVSLVFSGKSLERVRWEIIGAYLLGYDIIEVKVPEHISPEEREKLRGTIQNLIGLEILEEDSQRLVVQCLLDPSAVAPKKLLRRVNTITLSMQGDAVKALVDGDERLARLVVKRDDEVDRLYFLMVRLLRSAVQNPKLADGFGITPIDCLDYRVVANIVESIGDYAVNVAESYLNMPKERDLSELAEALKDVSSILRDMQNLAVGAFLSKKISLVQKVKEELHSKTVERLNRFDLLVAGQKPKLIPYLHTISASLSEIEKCCIDIADLVIPLS